MVERLVIVRLALCPVLGAVCDGSVLIQLHNKFEDLKGKIRVYVRTRPLSQKERDRGCNEALETQGKQSISVQDPKSKGSKCFEFDQVSER